MPSACIAATCRSLPEAEAATFQGIQRADGSIATRNFIGVLTTVNCSAQVARLISDHFRLSGELKDYPNVDGVVALTHKSGCAGGDEGDGTQVLRRTIGGYARHPNFAAVLIVGLGCESNQMSRLVEDQALPTGERIHTLVIQEIGGTKKTVRRRHRAASGSCCPPPTRCSARPFRPGT